MSQPARSDRSLIAEWRRTLDWPVLGACAALLAAGLVLSLAAGPPAAARIGYDDPFYFVYRHAMFAAGAFATLVGASLLSDRWARRFAAIVFLAAFVLMAVILFAGHEAKGAQRWIRMAGFTFQPSELIKPAVIVLSGWLLAQRQAYPEGPWAIVAFAFYTTTIGLLLLQPDVGQAALLTAAFVVTFFISGLPWRWAAVFAGGGAGLSALLYATLPHVRLRVNSFFDPTAYDTYQIDRAGEAIAKGGVLGVGPGEGRVKAALPDAHTDFIYAVAGEEFGFLFSLALMGLFAFVAVRGVLAAARIDDPYPRAAGAGLFALFGLQAAINIGVNVSLLPPKGMTLPFVSSGGSSLLGTALTIGLALALTRRRGARVRIRRAYV